jgi:hypothetical protein
VPAGIIERPDVRAARDVSKILEYVAQTLRIELRLHALHLKAAAPDLRLDARLGQQEPRPASPSGSETRTSTFNPRSQVRSLPGRFFNPAPSGRRMVERGSGHGMRDFGEVVLSSVLSSDSFVDRRRPPLRPLKLSF